MAGLSNIEWTDATWNPTTGCTRVSEGCRNCYAFQLHDMRHKAHGEGKAVPAQYAKPFKELQLFEDRLTTPLSWKKPRRIFVNSMSDLFHKDVPDAFIDRVFATMALATQHTFQVLTKRPERMAAYFNDLPGFERASRIIETAGDVAGVGFVHQDGRRVFERHGKNGDRPVPRWPLPNVWVGSSCENQAAADERIPHLLATPAAVRFLSCEPLLGPVWLCPDLSPYIQWVIIGGESGPGARPCDVAWVRSIVEQCKAAGVACFVKQMGAETIDGYTDAFSGGMPVKIPGVRTRYADRKGGDPSEWPADLRVREFPKAVLA